MLFSFVGIYVYLYTTPILSPFAQKHKWEIDRE